MRSEKDGGIVLPDKWLLAPGEREVCRNRSVSFLIELWPVFSLRWQKLLPGRVALYDRLSSFGSEKVTFSSRPESVWMAPALQAWSCSITSSTNTSGVATYDIANWKVALAATLPGGDGSTTIR